MISLPQIVQVTLAFSVKGTQTWPVTSMAKELGKQVSSQEIAHSLSRNFGVIFESQMLWLESLDALWGHPLGVPVKPPAELRQLHKEQLQTEEDTF